MPKTKKVSIESWVITLTPKERKEIQRILSLATLKKPSSNFCIRDWRQPGPPDKCIKDWRFP